MNPRVYVEASVIRCLTGRLSRDISILANQVVTQDWWRDAGERFELIASVPMVDKTRVGAPWAARDRLSALGPLAIVHPGEASEILGQQLIDSRALPANAATAAGHIAIAVVHGAEYLTTWDFQHVANPANTSRIGQVCRDGGFRTPVICTPGQLMAVRDKEPEDDPMIAEIREYRERQAARFGYDAAAIVRHYRALHEASGRPSVQYPPRRLDEPPAPKQGSGAQPDETADSGQG